MAAVDLVVAARVPERSWRSEARAVRVVWWRDMVRFRGDRARIVTALIQPLLFLLVLAPGLDTLSEAATDGVDLATFMFPGVLCMAMWFSGMISASSLVMDRELGFLREMTVAPVRRSSIILGKVLGGATIAWLQSVVFLALAPLSGIRLTLSSVLTAAGVLAVLGIALTAVGFAFAWKVDSVQGFHAVMNLLLVPMWLLSGAFFPPSGAPGWLAAVMRANPLTYGVAALRWALYGSAPEVGTGLPGPGVAIAVTLLAAVLAFGCDLLVMRGTSE